VSERGPDASDQGVLLLGRRHVEPLEIVPEAHVREQPRWVLVEVKESSGPSVERAPTPLSKPGQLAERGEQLLQLVERLGPGVLHADSLSVRARMAASMPL
jgi:hypothetical protein